MTKSQNNQLWKDCKTASDDYSNAWRVYADKNEYAKNGGYDIIKQNLEDARLKLEIARENLKTLLYK